MNAIAAGGVLIGVLCAAWTFVMGVTGWYKDPAASNLFFFVIAIEVAGLLWTLRRTASQGRTYSGQVVAGTLTSMIAAVIIFGASLAFTTLAYPTFFQDVEPMRRDVLQRAGASAAEIDAVIHSMTPMSEASTGAMYTVMTGIVVSAIMAVWVRAQGPRSATARV